MHLFEAEYTDLSREWVLALLDISKKHFSKMVLVVISPMIAIMLQMLDFFNKEETWILVLNLIFISALWF